MPFTDQGKPKPIVLVGKNGSGKTILLSSIVDSFYEFAADAFEDVASKSGVGHHYFRTAAGSQVKIGARGGVTCLWYKNQNPVKQGARCCLLVFGGIFTRANGTRGAGRANTGKGRQDGGRRFFACADKRE